MAEQTQRTVLVTGGSGYLGSFLVVELSKAGVKVGYTYLSTPSNLGAGRAYAVNLCTGDGLDACLDDMGTLDAIINCAAVSQPAACERDRATADALNVPTKLVEALRRRGPTEPLFIHISTDQVYNGTKALSTEAGDPPAPVNAYGASKLAAEAFLRAHWPRHFSLRSSIIFGPAAAAPGVPQVARALFLQWLDDALRKGPIELFEDEWRCPVFVFDIVQICKALMTNPGLDALAPAERTFNMGGPERLSRADMGEIVARVRGYPAEHAKKVPSASVKRPVVSPADISIDSSRIAAVTGVSLTSFENGVRRVFEDAANARGVGGGAERAISVAFSGMSAS